MLIDMQRISPLIIVLSSNKALSNDLQSMYVRLMFFSKHWRWSSRSPVTSMNGCRYAHLMHKILFWYYFKLRVKLQVKCYESIHRCHLLIIIYLITGIINLLNWSLISISKFMKLKNNKNTRTIIHRSWYQHKFTKYIVLVVR